MTHEDKIIEEFDQKFGYTDTIGDDIVTRGYSDPELLSWLRNRLITYRAQVLEEVKTFHDKQSLNGECAANNEGLNCCVEKYLKHPTN